MINYLLALTATIFIETLVVYLAGFRDKLDFYAVILVNFITHPLLHLILFLNNYFAFLTVNDLTIIIFEIAIAIIEGILLSLALKRKIGSMMLLSFAMNLTSFLIGKIIFI